MYMKRSFKSVVMLMMTVTICGMAGAQNNNAMEQNRKNRVADTVKSGYQKIEDGVVKGYKAIEGGVVSGYTAIQDGVVEGFTRISDAFVKKFLMREGETFEETKARIAREEEELRCQNGERAAQSGERSNIVQEKNSIKK